MAENLCLRRRFVGGTDTLSLAGLARTLAGDGPGASVDDVLLIAAELLTPATEPVTLPHERPEDYAEVEAIDLDELRQQYDALSARGDLDDEPDRDAGVATVRFRDPGGVLCG